jgi:hypothetical protein
MIMINFDEASHEYTRNGVLYISTTQLLKKYGLSVDYAGIPDAVLQKAASKGKAIHKGLELYIQGDKSMIGLLKEVELFDNYIQLKGLDIKQMTPEQVIYDDIYKIAGTVDLQYIDGALQYIADFKTTSSLHLDAVAWQLSIYSFIISKGDLMKYYFIKPQVIHFNLGKMYVKDIHTIDYDAVKALLQANLDGNPVFNYVKPNKILSDSEELLIKQLLNEKQQYEEGLKLVESELTIVLEKVKNEMEKHKEYAFRTPDINIIYTPEITRRSLNQTKVKNYIIQQGENIDDYYNESISAPAIKASIPKSKIDTDTN